MEKIQELTKEQIAKFPQYVEKWIKKGLTTERPTQEQAEKDWEEFQAEVLKMKPAPVVLLNSPSKCWDAVRGTFPETERKDLKFVYPYFDCQYWASWFSFYDFMENELGFKFPKAYTIFKTCQKYGMVWPLESLCVVCSPPTILKTNEHGLHNESGPAISYDGDNEIYALNGVVMEKEHVMTPHHKLVAQDILKESNVERRRELIRKVGIERLMSHLPHKLLDKRDSYELFSIRLSDEVQDARYLKMLNPSIGTFHLEGVNPDIGTISDALKWRNQNMFENPDVLT